MRPPATLRSRSSVTPPPDPLISSQLGDFVIEERIGSGGMGVVYRATHSLIGKQAAIKVLRAELVSPQLYERLLVEARAVNAIRHPGIIDIFGFGSLPDGRPYVVMELLQGRPLSDFVRAQTPLDVGTTLWVLDHMLAALEAAHRAGVVHRDLKPANVFLVELPGAATTLKLVDFGIAKLLESRDSPTTVDGTILGTPEFMAPEQIRGGTIGPATDLYAVGIMTFQMLTGVRPFQGDPMQVLFAHVDQPPPLPSTRAEGIPPELDTLVLHLLAKDPALRPASAEAVRQQLQRISLHPLPRALPVPGRGALRAPARAPVNASPHTESLSTVSLAASLRTGSRGWMVGGAVLLAGLGGGALWLGRSASSTEVPPIVGTVPTPDNPIRTTEPPAPPPAPPEPEEPDPRTTPSTDPEPPSTKPDEPPPKPGGKKGVGKHVDPRQPGTGPKTPKDPRPVTVTSKDPLPPSVVAPAPQVVTPTPPDTEQPVEEPAPVLPPATLADVRRVTEPEQRLARRLEELTGEFRSRTGGDDATSDLGKQLHGFYALAAQEQTDPERTELYWQMYKWQAQLRMRVPK